MGAKGVGKVLNFRYCLRCPAKKSPLFASDINMMVVVENITSKIVMMRDMLLLVLG